MKKLMIVSVMLCALALIASAAWSVNIPVLNQSFETTSDSPFTGYPDYWVVASADPGARIIADSSASDGTHVLAMTQTDGYKYIWGNYGDFGIPKKIAANTIYTLSIDAKLGTLPSPGGMMRLYAVSSPGVWAGVSGVVEAGVLGLTTDWQTYSVQLDTAANPDTVGSYFVIMLKAFGGAGAWQNGPGDPSEMYWDNLRLSDNVVPEPSSLLALGTSLVGLAGFVIRRRK